MAQAARKEPSEYNNVHYIIASLFVNGYALTYVTKNFSVCTIHIVSISSKLSEI
jgi:hypothetical protein